MLFKIGKTVRGNGVAIVAVPAEWERDGTLFWPQNLKDSEVHDLRKDPTSMPNEETWTKQKFILKAETNDFLSAFAMESILSSSDKTETKEEALFLDLKKEQETQTGYDCDVPADSSYRPCTCEKKLDHLNKRISRFVEANIATHSKIDKLQKTLDLILWKMDIEQTDLNSSVTIHDPELPSFQFPISTPSEIYELNKELMQNKNLETHLIKKFTSIAGDSGKKTASKVGVKIVENIISTQLLTKYSWTGRTIPGREPKLPFLQNRHIIDLCQKIIAKADNRFNKEDCENFFKISLLKHSNQRLSRKRKLYDRRSAEAEPEPEIISLPENESQIQDLFEVKEEKPYESEDDTSNDSNKINSLFIALT